VFVDVDARGIDVDSTEQKTGPKVYLPPDETDSERSEPRVFLPPKQSFFARFPSRWTWESWGKRVEYQYMMTARGLEALIWASIGAMVGLAATGIPGVFIDGYDFLVWQPLGAATGAIAGALLVWRRWRDAFNSQQQMDN